MSTRARFVVFSVFGALIVAMATWVVPTLATEPDRGPLDPISATLADKPAPDQASEKASDTVQLVFAGDIMLDDLPGAQIAKGVDPFAEFAKIFQAADAAIGNLECAVATKGEPADKKYAFRADPQVLTVLARHLRNVSLANNHSLDYGQEAFLEQLELLPKHKISWFGGGRNCAEARQPLILTLKGIRIALLGYNNFMPRSFEAGPSWPGTAWAVNQQIFADIRAAREIHHADLVIPFMHWGDEFDPANDDQKKLARRMIDNGADVVVGGHPHVTQGAEYYKGKLIVYSLGNFVFDGFEPGPGREGWLLRLTLDRRGLVSWDTVVAHIDDLGIPHLAADVASPAGKAGSKVIEERKADLNSAHENP